MIVAVDDEPEQLDLVRKPLLEAGWTVETFDRASQALERLSTAEPELIISDLMMPEMDGIAFREAYQARFPHRLTPFVLLTSQGDPESVVRGLGAGADDYLTKPVVPEVLQARVRAILARKARYARPTFEGDLARFPFIRVLRFCEASGLTGNVDFAAPSVQMTVRFRAGAMAVDDVERLTALYDLTEGRFTIRAQPVDLRPLEPLALAPTSPPPPPVARPMGRLSAVRAGQKVFQVQTELATYPETQVLTVVLLEGNAVLKRRSVPPASADRAALEEMIERQHAAVEDEIRERLDSLTRERETAEVSPKDRYYQLFEAGFEQYRQGRYAEAVASWEQARVLNPSDRVLETNIRVARGKLEGRRS